MRLWCGVLAFALVISITVAAKGEQRRPSTTLQRIEALWRARWDVAEREAQQLIDELGSEDAEQRQRIADIDAAVLQLQPWFSQAKTAMDVSRRGYYKRELVAAISRGTRLHGIDHRIATAMAMQETSLLPYYGYGGKSGSRGERGYFQVFPHGAAERVCSSGCNQFDPVCSATTAMCWLANRRTKCGDDPWMYVAAYNAGGCLSPEAARDLPYAKNVRARLCSFSDCSSIWPE